MLGPAFFSLLAMGAFGSPVIAVLGELAAKSKKKVFYDKYGQQTGAMGRILLILLLVIWGAAFGVIFTRFPLLAAKVSASGTPLLWACIASLAFFRPRPGLLFHLEGHAQRQGTAHLPRPAGCRDFSGRRGMAVPAKLLIAQPGEASFQTVFSSSMALPMAVMYPPCSPWPRPPP